MYEIYFSFQNIFCSKIELAKKKKKKKKASKSKK